MITKLSPMETESQKSRKVALIGLAQISAIDVYSLLVAGRIGEVVLVGKEARKLISDLNGLRSTVPLASPARVWKGEIPDCADAAVAVLSLTDESEVSSSVSHRTMDAASRMRSLVGRLRDAGFKGVLLVTRKPVELLTAVALEESGFSRGRVFGLGWMPEASVGNVEGIRSTDSEPFHSDNGKASSAWCTAVGSEVSNADICTADCPYFDTLLSNPGLRHGGNCSNHKDSPEKLAACVTQICEAVIDDLNFVMPIITVDTGTASLKPCVVGKDGIKQELKIQNSNGLQRRRFTQKTAGNGV